MKTYDVTIIGAGLAGLQCARLLSRQGVRILLVDRKHNLTKGVHTTGIFVRKTLEDFAFPSGSLGPSIRDVTLYSPDLRPIELKSLHDEFRVGKMGFLYETYLRECLANGVEVLLETRYIGSEPRASHHPDRKAGHPSSGRRGAGGLTSSIDSPETAVTLEKKSRQIQIKTTVLIGADGANSRVAKSLGLDENREWIVGYEEVYHSSSTAREPRLHCFLDAELAPGYLAWIADDGEEVHIGVGGYPQKFDPRSALEKFKTKTSAIHRLCNLKPEETRGGRIPVGGVLKRIANENGLLIGDAAGAVSPLTAGGLDPCIRLSTFAAEVILERLRTGNASVMKQYSGELFRTRFFSRIWMRRILKTFSSQALLEAGCIFLRTAAGRKLANHVFFGRGSFPDVRLAGQRQREMNY